MQDNLNQIINLLGLSRRGLADFLTTINEKSFRAQQILQWIHFHGITDFALMNNLSKSLRAKLAELAEIKLPNIAYESLAHDGTHKFVIRLQDGNCIETVFIPEKNRGTLCVSSQVGCTLN